MMWLDLSGAWLRVSSVPGVTHIVTWFTSFCNMVILSSGLQLFMTLQALSSFCVRMAWALGMYGGLLRAAAHLRVLESSIITKTGQPGLAALVLKEWGLPYFFSWEFEAKFA